MSIFDTLRGLPDLEKGLTRALHGTCAPAEAATTVRTLANLRSRLRPSEASAAGPLRSARLTALLDSAASAEVEHAALDLLELIDEQAAAAGDKLALMREGAGWTEVDQRRGDLAAARGRLGDELPGIRKTLGMPRLEYSSIFNQGDYLVDVPNDALSRVPKGRCSASCMGSRRQVVEVVPLIDVHTVTFDQFLLTPNRNQIGSASPASKSRCDTSHPGSKRASRRWSWRRSIWRWPVTLPGATGCGAAPRRRPSSERPSVPWRTWTASRAWRSWPWRPGEAWWLSVVGWGRVMSEAGARGNGSESPVHLLPSKPVVISTTCAHSSSLSRTPPN